MAMCHCITSTHTSSSFLIELHGQFLVKLIFRLSQRLLWPCEILFTAEPRLCQYYCCFSDPQGSGLSWSPRAEVPQGPGLGPLPSFHTHSLAVPMPFHTIQTLMTLKYIMPASFSLEFQTQFIHCWLDISTWMSTGTIYLTCQKQNPYLPSSEATTFPISGNGASILPVG